MEMNLSEKRTIYLTGIASYYEIELSRVIAIAKALGESEDKGRLISELENIKHIEKINRMRGLIQWLKKRF